MLVNIPAPWSIRVIKLMVIWLVVSTILKNMKVNGKDYPRYYGKINNIPNHQPDNG
jgi:hypothetical protein